MSNTMTATKTCKQCGEALPLTAFGTKQARCKQCINALRAGKAKLVDATTAVPNVPAAREERAELPAPVEDTDTQKFHVKGKFDRAVKDMSADEKLEYTLARAEDAQKRNETKKNKEDGA